MDVQDVKVVVLDPAAHSGCGHRPEVHLRHRPVVGHAHWFAPIDDEVLQWIVLVVHWSQDADVVPEPPESHRLIMHVRLHPAGRGPVVGADDPDLHLHPPRVEIG